MKKRLSLVLLLMLPGTVSAAVSLIWGNGGSTRFKDVGYLPLSAGAPSVNGDGNLVQVGYYSTSSSSAPFSGVWVQLAELTLGDRVTRDIGGGFSYGTSLSDGIFEIAMTTDQAMAVGLMLAVRFFDANTASGATHYNAVASPDWVWPGGEKHDPLLNSSTTSPVWLGGASSAFRTTIAIPEPSGLLMLGGALAGWCFRRRK